MFSVSLPTLPDRWCYVDAGYGGGADANSNSQDQSFGGGESYNSGYSGNGEASTSAARAANAARAASNHAAAQQVAARKQAAARAEQARLAEIAAKEKQARIDGETLRLERLEDDRKPSRRLPTKNLNAGFKKPGFTIWLDDELVGEKEIIGPQTMAPEIFGKPEEKEKDEGVYSYEPRDDINLNAKVDNKATPEQIATARNNDVDTAQERSESVGYTSMTQEASDYGVFNTLINHIPGLIPGVSVQAKTDFDGYKKGGTEFEGRQRAGNDTTFGIGEAIGDTIGLLTGTGPILGAAGSWADDKFGSKYNISDYDLDLGTKAKGLTDQLPDSPDFDKLSTLEVIDGLKPTNGKTAFGDDGKIIEKQKAVVSEFFNIPKSDELSRDDVRADVPPNSSGLLSNYQRIQNQSDRLSPTERFSTEYYG